MVLFKVFCGFGRFFGREKLNLFENVGKIGDWGVEWNKLIK